MPVERVVVDRELRIERLDHSAGRDDQRVDLAEHGVEARVGLEELRHDRGDLLLLRRIVDTGLVHQPPGLPRVEPLERVDVEAHERLRCGGGDLLDVHAALRREHEQGLPGATIEGQRQVVLLLDLRRLLDPELVDDVTADVEPEDVARTRLRVRRCLGELDAACLAAPAGEHLRLDDDGAAELLRGLTRLERARGEPAVRDGDADTPEELLALVLVEVHRGASIPTRRPAPIRRASMEACCASAFGLCLTVVALAVAGCTGAQATLPPATSAPASEGTCRLGGADRSQGTEARLHGEEDRRPGRWLAGPGGDPKRHGGPVGDGRSESARGVVRADALRHRRPERAGAEERGTRPAGRARGACGGARAARAARSRAPPGKARSRPPGRWPRAAGCGSRSARSSPRTKRRRTCRRRCCGSATTRTC